MIERIKEVMYDPERIRNVATSSHVHHGKCVSADTLIFLENKTITAKELFEIAKKDGILVKKGLEEVYKLLNPIKVLTYKDGRISKGLITHAWKIRNFDRLIEVETIDGRRIKVTPEHKFLIFNGKIEEKEARKLKKGEMLVLPKIIPSNSINIKELKEYILKKLSKDNSFLAYLNENLKRKIECKKIKVADLIKIAKKFQIDLSEIYDNIELISYSYSKKIKLPKSEKEFIKFFYLLGLLFGNKNVNLKKFKKYLNVTFKKFINRVFEYPLKSKVRKIPSILFNLPFHFISSFLKGCFDINGSLHQAVYISSKNRKILQGIQLLLLRFGCCSYIVEKGKHFVLNIPEKEKFIHLVNYKQKNFENLTSLNFNTINVPFVKIDESQIIFLPIANIKEIDSEDFVYDFTVEETHNFLANGFFIHNTTLTDNLMAGAGMIAEEMAGKVMYTWIDEQERERQLTIYGANVSMIHEYKGKDYLINLVDTPGHVDFGGDVTRAMRAVDGTIVLVCAVEGIMPQTETVFRQALRERVKPVLFINKVDRLIKEVKLTPQQMMERFEKIIKEVNLLIQKYAEPQFREKWYVSVQNGSVAFGSAKQRWAISLPYMQETGISFKEIIQLVQEERYDELAKIAPLHKVVLDMIIRHLPSPKEAIKYRLEKIWNGDLNSEYGRDMLFVNPNGKLAAIVTKVVPDPHVGFVATVRIFSGKLFKGKDVLMLTNNKVAKIQQVAIYKGIQRIPVEEIPAGNIAAVVGIPEAFTGETICEANEPMQPFVEIKHLFEPVVTKAIEPKNPQDLTKLIEALQKIAKEDSVLKVKINQETGEYLVCGLGELHIEAKVENKLKEMGFDIVVSPPIVVYREVPKSKSQIVEAKSPNKHNRFYIVVEPLEDGVYEAFVRGELEEHRYLKTKKDPKLIEFLIKCGMDREDAKNVIAIHGRNVLIDLTKGVQFMNEVIELVIRGFEEAMEDGPLAREPCSKMKVKIVDAEIHEDPVHRGPAQIVPTIKFGILKALLLASATLYEPKQIIRIDVPYELVGDVINELQRRRAQVLEIKEESGAGVILTKIPVSETFGLDAALKSATSGRAFYSIVDITYEEIPKELFESTVKSIRKRKGLKEEIPKPEDFI
jgi:elongation factor 2